MKTGITTRARRILCWSAAGCWLAAIGLAVARAQDALPADAAQLCSCVTGLAICLTLTAALDGSHIHGKLDQRLTESIITANRIHDDLDQRQHESYWELDQRFRQGYRELRAATEMARRNAAETRRNTTRVEAVVDGLRAILDEVGDEAPESMDDEAPTGPVLRIVDRGETG